MDFCKSSSCGRFEETGFVDGQVFEEKGELCAASRLVRRRRGVKRNRAGQALEAALQTILQEVRAAFIKKTCHTP